MQAAAVISEHESRPSWRALTVRSRHEKVVAHNLRSRGLEEFLPLHRSKRQWSDRSTVVELPLFPGYVFCRLTAAQRLLALSSPGVTSIVGFGGEDAAVDDSEIGNVQNLLSSNLHVEPWPYLRTGQLVQIHAGPLAGLKGTVVREKGSWHLVVSVELLQRAVGVEIGRNAVHAIGDLPKVAENLTSKI